MQVRPAKFICAIGAIMIGMVQLVQLIPVAASTPKYYSVSKAGINLIKSFEGLRLQAYEDSSGVVTIGYGTTKYFNGAKVKLEDVITKERAEALLTKDITKAEHILNVLVDSPLKQNEVDALISFIYNVGFEQFKESTLLKKLNTGVVRKEVAVEFDRWVHVSKDGVAVRSLGLVSRREAERRLFIGGVPDVLFRRQLNKPHSLYEAQNLSKRVGKGGKVY